MDEKDQVGEIARLIERWCPPQFRHESGQMRTTRAFLNAIACVDELRTVMAGAEPIRTDYPDPAWPPKP